MNFEIRFICCKVYKYHKPKGLIINMEKNGLVNKVLKSFVFQKAFFRASRLSKNSKSIMILLGALFTKMQNEGEGSTLDKIKYKVKTLALLVKSYANGSYKQVETKNIIIILAGFIYLLSPLDLIPDVLPIIGFADDIALISFIFNSLSEEMDKFNLWQKKQSISNQQ